MNYCKRVNFNAKFEPNGNYILHGTGQYDIYEQFQSYDAYRNCLKNFPPIMSVSFIGLYNDLRYDLFARQIIMHVSSYSENSLIIPQIGLEFCKGELKGSNYEKDIAEGRRDEEIAKLMLAMKGIDRPIFIRPGYGFNGEWNGYDAHYYKLAFRRIKKVMQDTGCDNVSLVWSYNPAALDKDYEKYYPGDEYVDWWGIEIFQTPEESAPYTYTFLSDAEKHRKPVMLGEATAFRYGATLEGWQKWFVSFFRYIKENAVIKAACYINWDWTKYAKWRTWGDCRLEANKELIKLYRNEMKNKIWLNDVDKEFAKKVLNYGQNEG